MKLDLDFRNVFRPIQPAAVNKPDFYYSEWLPSSHLAPYVFCYWRLRSINNLHLPFTYRVIPDGCIDIFFSATNPNDFRVMGFSTFHTIFELGQSFDYVGVRFFPGAFALLFGIDASALTNKDEELHAVIPRFAKDLIGNLNSRRFGNDIRKIVDNTLLRWLSSAHLNEDRRFTTALYTILRSHGNMNLKLDIDTGMSPRQLRRKFQFYVGDSPKSFSKVVRFQYFLKLLSSPSKCHVNSVFLDAGYYDQSHFNKEFKAFCGLTPGEALF